MNDKKKDKIIYTAVQLWAEISKSAAFENVDYDSALLNDIKSHLNIDKSKDLLKELKNISVEELLNALFTSIEPFSEMLKDLLEVFSMAGAKYGDKNLKMAVDFGKLEIDFERFKVDVETVSEIIYKTVNIYCIDDIWGLRNLFEFNKNEYNTFGVNNFENDEICDWINRYYNDKLPNYFPKQPKFNEEVDCRVEVIWNYLRKIYGILKSVYKEELGIKRSLGNAVDQLPQQCEKDANTNTQQGLAEKIVVLENERDCYIGTMMAAIKKFVEHLQSLGKEKCDLSVEFFKENFDGVFQNFESVKYNEVIEKIKQIKSFLNLPYWEHRYEIYSAWVFTLISKAFGYSNLNYKLVNGNTLSFSFGGSRLATYNQGEPLEIWAECRSDAIVKIEEGKKGRKNGIQPDYTIAYADAKVPGNAIAVVECKQYKKSNSYNFSEAIIDYANNRPNAKIFLVNYGVVGNSVNQKVISKGIDKTRFATFGNVRPQNSERFVAAMKSYLFEPLKITLTWGECPADLDLILKVTDLNTGDDQQIFYHNKGQSEFPPYAVLDYDYTKGFGPENITVFKIESGKSYFVEVDKYSNENEIIGEVTLNIECNAFKKKYTKNKIFKQWYVCAVEDGQIKSIDIIK